MWQSHNGSGTTLGEPRQDYSTVGWPLAPVQLLSESGLSVFSTPVLLWVPLSVSPWMGCLGISYTPQRVHAPCFAVRSSSQPALRSEGFISSLGQSVEQNFVSTGTRQLQQWPSGEVPEPHSWALLPGIPYRGLTFPASQPRHASPLPIAFVCFPGQGCYLTTPLLFNNFARGWVLVIVFR